MRGRKLTDEEREISEQKRREYRNRKSRERYAYRKEHHLCVACAVPLTGDDPLMCPECRAKTRKTNSAVQQREALRELDCYNCAFYKRRAG